MSQELNWAFIWESPGQNSCIGHNVVVDNEHNILVYGATANNFDMDPSSKSDSSEGKGFFLIKYTPDRSLIWGVSITFSGNYSWMGLLESLVVDDHNNIFIGGGFRGTLTIHGKNHNLSVYNGSNINNDIFFAKLDANGNVLWLNMLHSPADAGVRYLSLDSASNLYMLGNFNQTIDVDPGLNTQLLSKNTRFLAKYDSLGSLVWAYDLYDNFGPNKQFEIYDMKVRNSYIYLTGHIEDTIDFDITSSVQLENSIYWNGYYGSFIAKYDLSANLQWVKILRASPGYNGPKITIDKNENIYIAGKCIDSSDFDPGPGVAIIKDSTGHPILDADGFLAKYDKNGSFQWLRQFSCNDDMNVKSLEVSDFNTLYMVGDFDASLYLAGNSIYKLSAQCCVSGDGFIASFATNGNHLWSFKLGMAGNDAVLDVAIDHQSRNIYTTGRFNGSATLPPYEADMDPQNGTYYLSQGGFLAKYSHCVINAGSRTISQCANEPYIFSDFTKATKNTVKREIINSLNGCDTLVMTTVNFDRKVDTALFSDGRSLFVDTGNIYQWLNCNVPVSLVPGADSNHFYPVTNGFYSVEIEENDCIDTSRCQEIFTVGMLDDIKKREFSIFPNPARNLVFVSANETFTGNVTLLNSIGVELMNINLTVSRLMHEINLCCDMPSGIYMLRIKTKESHQTIRLVIDNY